MKNFVPALAVIASLASSHALAATNMQSLMLKAMQSPSHQASEIVTGPGAEIIRKAISKPDAQILVTVQVIGDLPQEGCKKLRLKYSSPGTLLATTDGKSRELDMGWTMNMCASGLPPDEDQAKGVSPYK